MLDKFLNRKPKDKKKEQLKAAQKKGAFKKGYDPRRHMTGRPKKGETRAEIVADLMMEVDEKTGETEVVTILRKWVLMAKNGSIKAGENLMDAMYGKTPDEVNLHTDDDSLDTSSWSLEDQKALDALIKKNEIGE